MDINIVDYQYRTSVGQSFSHSIDLLHVTHSSYSPPYKREGSLAQLTFAKNSGTVTGDREKNCQLLTGAFSNYPRNNCGTHFGSSLPLISKVANGWQKQYLIHFRLAWWWWLQFSAQEVEQMPTPLTREKWRKSTSNDSFFTCKSFYQSKYDLHWVINKFLF